MRNLRPLGLIALLALALLASLLIACGNASPSRRLQSISVAPSPDIDGYEFIATGTYSAPPVTVAPLAVSWYSIDPSQNYTLTSVPYSPCNLPHGTTITAIAPANPNAPISGSIQSTKMVQASATLNCP